MSATASQHVLPNLNGGWTVVRNGSTRASRVFRNHSEAVQYARNKAKKEGALLFVHRSDGTIQEMDSYSRDAVRSRAKR
jgi:hypothetical protein